MAQTAVENTPTQQNVVGSITIDDGFTVESNYETPAQLREGLGIDEPAPAKAEPATSPGADERPRRNRRSDPRAAVETAVGRQREAERAAREATERAERLAAEIESLKKTPAAVAPAAAPFAGAPAPVATPQAPVQAQPQMTQADYKRYMAMADAPKETDFAGENGWKEYQFAVNHFVTQKMLQEHSQRLATMTAEQQVHAQFTQRLDAAKTRIPDFDQRFNPQTPIDTRIFPYIQRLENAPDVMLYLSEHQDIAQRLTALHPLEQIGQIGEIAGTLKAQSAAASSPASARPAISQALPPTKRVSGAPPVAVSDDLPGDDATDAQHDAWRAAHPRNRRHRRYR